MAYGNALVNIGATNLMIIACDADVGNSDFSAKFKVLLKNLLRIFFYKKN